MQGGVESNAGGQVAWSRSRAVRAPENVGLGPLAQPRLGEFLDSLYECPVSPVSLQATASRGDQERNVAYIFAVVLVNSQVNRAERTSPYLLLDHVLIDAVNGCAVVFAIGVLGPSMQSLLHLAGSGDLPAMVSQGALIARKRPDECSSVYMYRTHRC